MLRNTFQDLVVIFMPFILCLLMNRVLLDVETFPEYVSSITTQRQFTFQYSIKSDELLIFLDLHVEMFFLIVQDSQFIVLHVFTFFLLLLLGHHMLLFQYLFFLDFHLEYQITLIYLDSIQSFKILYIKLMLDKIFHLVGQMQAIILPLTLKDFQQYQN